MIVGKDKIPFIDLYPNVRSLDFPEETWAFWCLSSM
jgi:hypothetical protein